MGVWCKTRNQKSMSDSNIEVLQNPNPQRGNVGSKCKDCCSFSGQYKAPTASNVPNISNNHNERVAPNISTNPLLFGNNTPPYYANCSCPPQPYPPQDDLWDLQFCRWWGWNWVRKRDEIVSRQKQTRFTPKRGKSPCSGNNTKKTNKPSKQDDFFSWCNKLFRGRQKQCPLKLQEKEQLQEMYDTPSVATMSKCCRTPVPKWDPPRKNRCYCTNGRQTSLSTVFIKNKTRREVDKCDRRKYQSWLYEKGESSSSEEPCPCVCRYPKSSSSSTEESVEYLALRMECLNSDNEDNCCRFQKQSKCCRRVCPDLNKKRYTKSACPCKLKLVCERKNKDETCKNSKKYAKVCDPYNKQFSQWKCCCGQCCTCIQDAPVRYPQFSRIPNKYRGVLEPDPVCTTKKEYIIRCPVVHCKKGKKCCKCACYCTGKSGNVEPKYNKKMMLDKSVSCPDISKKSTKNSLLENNQYANSFMDSMAFALKSGQFSSPVTGKTYTLNPSLIQHTALHNSNFLPNPLNINEPFLKFYGGTTETPAEDNEHKLLLTAVCEAIMSSHSSDQESDNVFDEDMNYFYTDNLLSPLKRDTFPDRVDSQPLIEPTDKFIGHFSENGKFYETIPLKSTKTAGISKSRIPLLKRKLIVNDSIGDARSDIFKTSKRPNLETCSNNVSDLNPDTFMNNFKLNLTETQNSTKTKNNYSYPISSLGANSTSFKTPWTLLRSSKLPGFNGLFSAISSSFTNKNDKNNIHSCMSNQVRDSVKFYSKNSTLPNESILRSPNSSARLYGEIQGDINNFGNKNRFWKETLATQSAQGSSAIHFPFNSLNTLDLNLYDTNDNEVQSNLNLSYGRNYLEDTSSLRHGSDNDRSSSIDIEKVTDKYTMSKVLQTQDYYDEDIFSKSEIESSRDDFTNTTSYDTEMFGDLEFLSKLKIKNAPTNTITRKSRIPIHDPILKEHNKLLPIIEEHSTQPNEIETIFNNPGCSQEKNQS